MISRKFMTGAVLGLAVLLLQSPQNPSAAQAPLDAAPHRATVEKYCATCHNSRVTTTATATGVVLDKADITKVADNPELWEKVVRKLRTGTMPPESAPRPDRATHDALVGFLESRLDRAAAERPNPGRPMVHRLNRAEYANAIRDLLGLEVDAATLLPPDDTANGFDNIADVLSLSPALLESYLSAAAKISALAVGSPKITASSETYKVRGDMSQVEHLEGLPLGTRGGVAARHTFPLDGEYVIRVKLVETNLGTIRGLQDENQLEVTVGGQRVLLAPVGGYDDYMESGTNATNIVNALYTRLQARVAVRAGQRQVTAAFLNPASSLGPIRLQQHLYSTIVATDHLGLPHIEYMTVSGPFSAGDAGDTPSRERVFACRPARPSEERACATTILSKLARRAYRRPVTEADMSGLLRFYDEGRKNSFEAGIEMGLRAMLASPKFAFRAEKDPAGVAAGRAYALNDLELASRLSFFIWSSIPDEELLALAESRKLRDPKTLAQQIQRMIADSKSQALVSNFAGQWLQLRNIRSATPDKNDFPNFDHTLRQAFARELELFVGSVIREKRSVLELLSADYTFVNERLALHYGIPNIFGSHFRRVSGIDERRRGLLGKGGILMVTSHADRTAPVVRGKWILDNLVGSPPPPPPPEVPALPDVAQGAKPLTMRARMEQHRANPVCANCHKVMDPMGLALENFDAVGAWRTDDGGQPLDTAGQLPDGTKIDGVVGLRETLLKQPDVFVTTVTEKLLTYALGRGLEAEDMPAVRAIVRQSEKDNYRFTSLIEGVVNSTPFRMRRAEEK